MQTQEAPAGGRAPVTEDQLREALRVHDGNATKVAAALGIHRATVYKLIDKWRIQLRRTVEVL